jgi:nucleoid DNA-binding protein
LSGRCLSCTVNVSSFGVSSDRKTSQSSHIQACPKTGAEAWLNNDNAYDFAAGSELGDIAAVGDRSIAGNFLRVNLAHHLNKSAERINKNLVKVVMSSSCEHIRTALDVGFRNNRVKKHTGKLAERP